MKKLIKKALLIGGLTLTMGTMFMGCGKQEKEVEIIDQNGYKNEVVEKVIAEKLEELKEAGDNGYSLRGYVREDTNEILVFINVDSDEFRIYNEASNGEYRQAAKEFFTFMQQEIEEQVTEEVHIIVGENAELMLD